MTQPADDPHAHSVSTTTSRAAGLRVAAVTFDFWNTLYSADGGAMDAVRPRRVDALVRVLGACGMDLSQDAVAEAYRTGFEAYMTAWNQGTHFGAPEQVRHILRHYHVDPDTVDPALIASTVTDIEEAAYAAPLDLISGVAETIPALAANGCSLGVISDTSLTPGRILRRFLEKDGLLAYFGALTFSDETGYTKPDPRMFESTLAILDVTADRAAHVGDTPRTDIAGAQAMGMLAVRCAAAVDHQEPPEAAYVIRDHRELLEILRRSSPV